MNRRDISRQPPALKEDVLPYEAGSWKLTAFFTYNDFKYSTRSAFCDSVRWRLNSVS
jgi:hypothetical protein